MDGWWKGRFTPADVLALYRRSIPANEYKIPIFVPGLLLKASSNTTPCQESFVCVDRQEKTKVGLQLERELRACVAVCL